MSTPTIPTSKIYFEGKPNVDKSIDDINRGNAFCVSNVINTGAGVLSQIYVKPQKAATEYHVTFSIAADSLSGTEMWIFEGTGSTTTGAHEGITLTPWNMKRSCATGSILFIQGVNTGASGTGSKIYSIYRPPNVISTFGNPEAMSKEFILNSNTSYIIIITGSIGRLGFESYWYEK